MSAKGNSPCAHELPTTLATQWPPYTFSHSAVPSIGHGGSGVLVMGVVGVDLYLPRGTTLPIRAFE